MRIFSILDRLEATSSSKERIGILKAHADNIILRGCFVYALDPYRTYGTGQLPMMLPPSTIATSRLADQGYFTEFFSLLDSLAARKLTGNDAIRVIEDFFGKLPNMKSQKWFSRILLKNLRCGCDRKTVNKVWPDLIPGFGVQLANLLRPDTKLNFPVIVDPKIDGLRLVAIKKGGKVTLYTRRGHVVETLPEIRYAIQIANIDNTVLDGEAQGVDWNESQSIVSSTVNKVDSSKVKFHVFDVVSSYDWERGECEISALTRKKYLDDVADRLGRASSGKIVEVPWQVGRSRQDIDRLFEQYLKEGYEGAMVKDPGAPYEFKRSSAVLKVKPYETVEGTVVGWEYGTGKREKGVGAVVVSVSGIETRVGSGFTDADLSEMNENPDGLVGKVAEVKCQQVTRDGKLRHPVFLRWREDT